MLIIAATNLHEYTSWYVARLFQGGLADFKLILDVKQCPKNSLNTNNEVIRLVLKLKLQLVYTFQMFDIL